MAVCIWDGSTDGDWNTAANWNGAAVPVNGDSVIIPADATVDIDGFDASAVTLVGFTVEEGCTIAIGSSTSGVATEMQICLLHTAAYYNADLAGTGETYLNITNYGKIIVRAAGPAPGTGEAGLNITGTHDAADAGTGLIHVMCGSGETISIGAYASADMEVNEITLAGGEVEVGAAVTEHDDAAAPDVKISGGTLLTHCPLGTVSKTGGTWTHKAGTVTTITASKGTTKYESSGTVTTFNLYGGTLDFSGDLSAKTVTTMNIYTGAKLKDPNEVVTFTNDLILKGCGVDDVTLEIGKDLTLARS